MRFVINRNNDDINLFKQTLTQNKAHSKFGAVQKSYSDIISCYI
jgi:hypothetical protein